MSTGLSCEFLEPKPGEWFYILERGSAPKSAWDWREFADAYGPFTSYPAAQKHLHQNHANPGGWSTYGHADFKMDQCYERLFLHARADSRLGR
jgi:hypothetical protein